MHGQLLVTEKLAAVPEGVLKGRGIGVQGQDKSRAVHYAPRWILHAERGRGLTKPDNTVGGSHWHSSHSRREKGR